MSVRKYEALVCPNCSATLEDCRCASTAGFQTVTAYDARDVAPLVEAADTLGEALERVSYGGEVGDVEDVDSARHDIAEALNLFRSQPQSEGTK